MYFLKLDISVFLYYKLFAKIMVLLKFLINEKILN